MKGCWERGCREEFNPPVASLMQNMSSGWLLTATLQPLYGSLQGAHCKQWHFTAASAALWNYCHRWSSCYWGLFLRVFVSLPVPLGSGRGWVWCRWSPSEMERGLLLGGLEKRGGRDRLLGRRVISVLPWWLTIWVRGSFFVSSSQLSMWVGTLDKNWTRVAGIMVLPSPSFLCLSSCLFMSSPSFCFFPVMASAAQLCRWSCRCT